MKANTKNCLQAPKIGPMGVNCYSLLRISLFLNEKQQKEKVEHRELLCSEQTHPLLPKRKPAGMFGFLSVLSSTISTYISSLSLSLSITITASAPACSAFTALLTKEQPLEDTKLITNTTSKLISSRFDLYRKARNVSLALFEKSLHCLMTGGHLLILIPPLTPWTPRPQLPGVLEHCRGRSSIPAGRLTPVESP
ncbi:hypothetical protein E2C01_023528 [Portunus trituberculatus]|uniref:Uncharacterized protein n=1 Tax=Portunus trituberculatus TaxID=210409 RepID=A0A5B7EA80_PORTR|nr:hypothetical protein [Portunus trituberculatus]